MPLAQHLMPLARALDPERAHRLGLHALRAGLGGRAGADDPRLAVSALGLRFANPLGLAAGFDKDAEAAAALMRLGFGFVEAGTVTLRPQPGNPRPRLFRLVEDRAIINRMGFNNAGIARFAARLARLGPHPVPLGANLGLNKEDADPERDYPALLAAVVGLVDYVTLNVSSPNTPGLRALQAPERLAAILKALTGAGPGHPPILVKLAPDLPDEALAPIVAACLAGGARGLIISNTTLARPGSLRSPHASEAGGLSGAPLFAPATRMLARAALLSAGRLTLVGVGGIASGEQALAKIRAGASLVQLYTGFAYAGPALIPRLKRELLAALATRGLARLADAVGIDAGPLAQED